jgi:FlaA1/EpsC-like NDP-sugar epimerase
MKAVFEGKEILLTGGTGSLGKTLVRRILSSEFGTPEKLIIFSRDEAKQHEMRLAYIKRAFSTDEVIYDNFKQLIEFRIGDVRDFADVCSAVKNVQIVINAAALKQVPVCEYFPAQALMTNCMGACNIVRAIYENDYPVETVVGVSTDKAAKPINVMGMTKAIQERIFTSSNILNTNTRSICTRYGNVLASRGSVIPLFHHQIRNGGPVTVTDPRMTRFLLSLDYAVDTIVAALEHAKSGETYVPDVPSATIMNIAKALIGDRDIAITGIRPGEKTHEILISEEEIHHCTRRGDFFVIFPMLPELQDGEMPPAVLVNEFSSSDNILDLPATVELLNKHQLMLEDINIDEANELLR